MAKAKGDETVDWKRFWVRGSDDTRKELAVLAIRLDTSVEKLAGFILADVVARFKNEPEQLRKLLPRTKP